MLVLKDIMHAWVGLAALSIVCSKLLYTKTNACYYRIPRREMHSFTIYQWIVVFTTKGRA